MRFKMLVAAVLLAPLPALAAADMQAGLWEMTTTTEMPGMPPMKQTAKQCLTKEQLSEKSQVSTEKDTGCKMLDQSQSGNTMRFKMSCADGQTMSGQVTYANGSYEAKNVMEMKEDGEVTVIKSSVVAKRVGDCK